MALRLLEVMVPNGDREEIPRVLKEANIFHTWTSGPAGSNMLVRVLLDASDTEKATDLLTARFGSSKDFRMILLAVEATLPSVVKEQPEQPKEASGKSSPSRIGREELYEEISQSINLNVVYVTMVALSSVVAATGMIRGNVAIVIGAMLIAPLLGPNIALPLAATLGDGDLTRRSLKAIGTGVLTVAIVSLAMGLVVDFDPGVSEIAGRTRPGIGDIVIALAAGSAGTLAFTSGVPAVVVGVMVAVALLPPLVATGLLAGAGYGSAAMGALLLAFINVTCINLSSVATFFLQKVRPRTWWEADKAKRATRFAVGVWIVMLAVLIVLIFLAQVEEVKPV